MISLMVFLNPHAALTRITVKKKLPITDINKTLLTAGNPKYEYVSKQYYQCLLDILASLCITQNRIIQAPT